MWFPVLKLQRGREYKWRRAAAEEMQGHRVTRTLLLMHLAALFGFCLVVQQELWKPKY